MKPLLQVKNLVTQFHVEDGVIQAVNGISIALMPGEILAIVGESGSGKSVSMLSVMGLIPQPPGKIVSGEILLDGRDLTRLSKSQMARIRGKEIAMIFQDPMTSLNPVMSIGRQIDEALLLHMQIDKAAARKRTIELLEMVGIPDAANRARDFPHQFSGGMRQRVMIAMALACNPKVLIADEPTTALDVTIQAQIIALVKRLQRELGMAVVWITHDLGVVASLADRVAVMYAGRIVEQGTAAGVLGALMIIGFVLTAVFAEQISPYDPTERVAIPFQKPSAEHILGTNDIGQDIFSELVYGARVSLTIGVVASIVAVTIGTTVGLLAGYYPRVLGNLLMRGVDIILILPFLPLLIMLAAYLGRSLFNTVMIIGLLIWAGSARIIRSQVLTIAQQDYVLAAKAIGASDFHIITRHILPQVLLLTVGQFVQATSGAILLEAALSFLGLGDPLQKSWGTVLYWAQVRGVFLTPAWRWWVLPPGILISLAALGFALMGFALEQIINPRLKQ